MAHAASFHPLTILCVEINPEDISLMHAAALRAHASFQIQCFMDLASARKYLLGSGAFQNRAAYPFPVLVMLDYNLDGELGTDLIQWIRNDPQFDGLTVILITDGQPDDRIAFAYTCGATHCLRKPGAFDAMVSIARCLSHCAGLTPACFDALKQLPEYVAGPSLPSADNERAQESKGSV